MCDEVTFMRVLDLGCGDGFTPEKLSLPPIWHIIGIDVKYSSIAKAHSNFPQRPFVCSAAESLPFPASSFDRVISNVALPYMDIPKVLGEIHRVLAPGGTLLASLHPWSVAIAELRKAFPRPQASLFRGWVLANGLVFHIAGRNLVPVRNMGESFQTERGIRIAMQRANFAAVSFRRDSKRWFVEALKPVAVKDEALAA
jgi:ubiquinone/menaquinone biosynthesis C-methylase UbiE